MEFEKLKENLIEMLKEGRAYDVNWDDTKEFADVKSRFFQIYEKKAEELLKNFYNLSLEIKEQAMDQAMRKSDEVRTLYEFSRLFSSKKGYPDTLLFMGINFRDKSVTFSSFSPDCDELFECKIDEAFNDAIEKLKEEFKEIFYVPALAYFKYEGTTCKEVSLDVDATISPQEDQKNGWFFSNVIEENMEGIINNIFGENCKFDFDDNRYPGFGFVFPS